MRERKRTIIDLGMVSRMATVLGEQARGTGLRLPGVTGRLPTPQVLAKNDLLEMEPDSMEIEIEAELPPGPTEARLAAQARRQQWLQEEGLIAA